MFESFNEWHECMCVCVPPTCACVHLSAESSARVSLNREIENDN